MPYTIGFLVVVLLIVFATSTIASSSDDYVKERNKFLSLKSSLARVFLFKGKDESAISKTALFYVIAGYVLITICAALCIFSLIDSLSAFVILILCGPIVIIFGIALLISAGILEKIRKKKWGSKN